MARYIDADKIIYWIRYVSSNGLESDVRRVAFKDEIERMPTADVAPRAEFDRVARELERVEALYFAKDTQLENAKAEVAKKIFEEIEDVINGIGYFDELDLKVLKKKYAEGK